MVESSRKPPFTLGAKDWSGLIWRFSGQTPSGLKRKNVIRKRNFTQEILAGGFAVF